MSEVATRTEESSRQPEMAPADPVSRESAKRIRLHHLLLSAYGVVRRSGLMSLPLSQRVYSDFYFAYKRYLEDPFYLLCRNSPELFSGGHVFDIGANIGYTAVLFAERVESPYKVFAFEPDDENFRALSANLLRRKLLERVTLEQAAVGNSNETLPLWHNSANPADHKIATHEFQAAATEAESLSMVKAWSLDEYMAQRGVSGKVSFVKIDVQGFELDVLLGMQEVLAQNPDLTLAVEYSPNDMRMLGYEPEELLRFLDKLDFHFSILEKSARMVKSSSSEIVKAGEQRGYLDFICRR